MFQSETVVHFQVFNDAVSIILLDVTAVS